MGGNMNEAKGKRDCEELRNVLGPHGLEKRNENGGNLLQTYHSNRMCIMNTFLKARVTCCMFRLMNKGQSVC